MYTCNLNIVDFEAVGSGVPGYPWLLGKLEASFKFGDPVLTTTVVIA
jgi:hypothetical protein